MPKGGSRPECSVDGCTKPNYVNGYCIPHYRRWESTGSPGDAFVHPRVVSESLDVRVSAHTEFRDGCRVWVTAGTRPKMVLGGTKKSVAVHVWEQVNGAVPAGLMVLHSCGNEMCVLLEHLYLGTAAQNREDAVRHGTALFGSDVRSSKLTAEDVRSIRTSTATGASLAALYGVSEPTISEIRNRRTWVWLDDV